jgi:hypothetical protein
MQKCVAGIFLLETRNVSLHRVVSAWQVWDVLSEAKEFMVVFSSYMRELNFLCTAKSVTLAAPSCPENGSCQLHNNILK